MTMRKEHGPAYTWASAMEESWGAVPGANLLDPGCGDWAQWRVAPPDKGEAASFGLVGQALKYKQSMAIALPLLNGEGITRLMMYLHRIRLDALEGGIRSPWLNPGNVEQNPDIVFISRPRSGFHELSRVPALHARILRSGGKTQKVRPTSETLVVDGAVDLMEMSDLIGKESHPFVLVVDGTRGGNADVWGIDTALEECFPGTPRIVLLSLGDAEAMAKIRQSRTRTHLWVMRVDDTVALTPGNANRLALQMGLIEDHLANASLESLAVHFFALRRELEKAKDHSLKERLAVIGKVFRALNELSVPLPYLEATLQNATRPGLFPVRCLARWLEIAGKGSCQYGETESASRNLITLLQGLHNLLMKSTTGKAGWLREHLRACRVKKSLVMVLCGSPHEVAALERWLDDNLDPDWSQTTHIVAMDGVKSYRQHRGPLDEVIITGMLWPSRQHWLATPCKKIRIPVYPYEQAHVDRLVQRWWKDNGASSLADGDKLRHWRLDWGNHRCSDHETVSTPPQMDVVKYTPYCEYPVEKVQAVVPINGELENWLDLLLEDPTEPESTLETGESLNPDLVWITTREHASDLPWAKTRPVLVLKKEEIHPTLPEFLAEGDQIILLKHTEERLATQERLFDMVAETEGMQQLIRAAGRWQTMVDAVAKRYRPNQVQPHLKKEGVDIIDQTISNWFRHKVYGPRDRAAVLVMARLSGTNEPEKAAVYIANGIERVRNMHQHVGQQLRKALIERGRGATTIKIGALELDGQAFDDMIEMATVESVRMPTTQVVAAPKTEGIGEIAEATMTQFPNRLHFTLPAKRSMRDSVYRDTEKFKACLTLMATALYEHYQSKKGRMHEVLLDFTQENIEFQPKMSGVTMGQFFDDRKYKGRAADMNRHFCLGNARDATRTLRIHFEWDEDAKLIVIHHAGKHLETTQT